MRSTTALLALTAASGAMAQTSPTAIAKIALNYLSSPCQAAVESLVSPNSTVGQCIRTDLIESIILSSDSIVPPMDSYLSTICYGEPCSNATLFNASQTLLSGCASDLTNFGVSNSTVELVFGLYPLAREVLCLKTTDPFNGTFNGTNASIPITSPSFNSTNGTFCATSLLTELSAVVGTNLTNSFIDTAALGGNASVLQLIESLPPSTLCDECIFAALDLVEQEYPIIGNVSVGANITLNTFLDGTCSAVGLNVTSNGTLPTNITESAFNSSYPFNITVGNMTYNATSTVLPPNISSIIVGNMSIASNLTSISSNLTSVASNITSAGNVTAVKKRWMGRE